MRVRVAGRELLDAGQVVTVVDAQTVGDTVLEDLDQVGPVDPVAEAEPVAHAELLGFDPWEAHWLRPASCR
jgi:hypothetical protein